MIESFNREAEINNRNRRVRILIAEDSEINQQVALGILDKKLGYKADAVGNGLKAINVLSETHYDLVLMDCQMPEMDGFEATEAIRRLSSPVLDHNIPIVAITANAMKSVREECLVAGMNDFISKPFDSETLGEVIQRNLKSGNKQHDFCEEAQTAKTGIDDERILSLFADDPDLGELVKSFLAKLPEHMTRMRDSLNNGCMTDLRRLAHQMKGAGGSYGYPMLSESAKVIEDAAMVEDIEAATLALSNFNKLIHLVLFATDATESSVGGMQ